MFVCYIHVLLHARRLASADTQLHIVYCILLHVCAMGTAAYIVCCVLLHVCAMGTAAYIVCCVLLHVCAMGTAAYIVCCVLLHVCAMGTAAYIVCCVLLHVCAMGTAAYIVCRVLLHVCAKGTAAYIVCCVLLHVCAMGTAAYIVCCVLLHVCAMGTAAYIVCCVLPHVCAKGTTMYIIACCVLPRVSVMGIAAYSVCCLLPRKFLPWTLHCHCMLHVLAGLHQITCCIYAATCSLRMRTSAIHAILCSAWHFMYCHTIHYSEYWSDMKFSINLGKIGRSKLLNLDQKLSIAMVLSTGRSLSCQPSSKSSSFQIIRRLCARAIPSDVLGCPVYPKLCPISM